MQQRTNAMRSPERGRPAFDRGEWASPVSSKLQKSTDMGAERQRNNPFHDDSKIYPNVTNSVDNNFIQQQNYMQNPPVQQSQHQLPSHHGRMESQNSALQHNTMLTNFSDVLGGRRHGDATMQREDIGADRNMAVQSNNGDNSGRDKLDELE